MTKLRIIRASCLLAGASSALMAFCIVTSRPVAAAGFAATALLNAVLIWRLTRE